MKVLVKLVAFLYLSFVRKREGFIQLSTKRLPESRYTHFIKSNHRLDGAFPERAPNRTAKSYFRESVEGSNHILKIPASLTTSNKHIIPIHLQTLTRPSQLDSPIDSGPPVSSSKSSSVFTAEQFKKYITDTLNDSQLSKKLSCDQVSILTAFEQDQEVCRDFFYFIVENGQFYQNIASESKSFRFWRNLLQQSLLEFAKAHPYKAQEIVEQVVVPEHPFLAQVPWYYFNVHQFIATNKSLHAFFSPTLANIFVSKISQIFINTDNPTYDAHSEFLLLLDKYEKTFFFIYPEFKYACAFLRQFHVSEIKNFVPENTSTHYSYVYWSIAWLAEILHDEMTEKSPELAQKAQLALEAVSPKVYQYHRGGEFMRVIWACVASEGGETAEQ